MEKSQKQSKICRFIIWKHALHQTIKLDFIHSSTMPVVFLFLSDNTFQSRRRICGRSIYPPANILVRTLQIHPPITTAVFFLYRTTEELA